MGTDKLLERVLVPFPGFLYLYHSPAVNRHEEKCSRPLPGVLISLQRTERAEASRISVLVPFPGFLYLYAVIAASGDSRLMVLVPFPGFLYLYMLVELLRIAVSTFSSPSRGSYISTFTLLSFASYTKFSSPSRGSYISTRMGTVRYAMPAYVLVPFPGFLYLYLSVPTTKQELEFSSPSRGSYISTLLTLNKTIHGFSSRPLPGVLISLHNKDSCYQALADRFSSPSRGSYISTFKKRSIAHNAFVLVPFPGFLYLYDTYYEQRKIRINVLVPFPGFLYLY